MIISGKNKGETIEDINLENLGYENKVIKNIIKDIRELLEDDFFEFKKIENSESITTIFALSGT